MKNKPDLVESFTGVLSDHVSRDELDISSRTLAKMLVRNLSALKEMLASSDIDEVGDTPGYLKGDKPDLQRKPQRFTSRRSMNGPDIIVEAVQLKSDKGDGIIFTENPWWLLNAFKDGTLFLRPGVGSDDAKHTFVGRKNSRDVCRTGDWVVYTNSGHLYFETTAEILRGYEEIEMDTEVSSDTPSKFRKLPTIVEAMQTGSVEKDQAVYLWVSNYLGEARSPSYYGDRKMSLPEDGIHYVPETGAMLIYTPGGPINVSTGDWVVRGSNGDFWTCRPDILKETYTEIAQ